MNQLAEEHCLPITATSQPVDVEEAKELLGKLSGWKISRQYEEPRLVKIFKFNDFREALEFTQKIGQASDEENHHPSLLTEWGKVKVDWWTHKIKGLHRNDFIMAAKSDEIYDPTG